MITILVINALFNAFVYVVITEKAFAAWCVIRAKAVLLPIGTPAYVLVSVIIIGALKFRSAITVIIALLANTRVLEALIGGLIAAISVSALRFARALLPSNRVIGTLVFVVAIEGRSASINACALLAKAPVSSAFTFVVAIETLSTLIVDARLTLLWKRNTLVVRTVAGEVAADAWEFTWMALGANSGGWLSADIIVTF